MKRIVCLWTVFCLLLAGVVLSIPSSAASQNTPDAEFSCVYSTAPAGGDVQYGSTKIIKMTAAEALANGVPTGYTDNVLKPENGSSMDVGILLDFSSLQIPVSDLESLTFRVWVGDDGNATDAYPEVRVYRDGYSWVMRYDLSQKTGQWVDITLSRDGTNFQSKRSFSSLASADGYLGRFGLCLRCKASKVDFYIDSITYQRTSEDFACQYVASTDTSIVQYGSTEILVMNAAQAAANGVPVGYSDRVLKVLNGSNEDIGILVDFSSQQIPTAALESITFRVWTGTTKITDTSPEIRISTLGATNWIMRYSLADRMEQWVDITLTRSGDNFQSKKSFADLADENGYLGAFCLAFRNKSASVDFYIDRITYQLVEDREAPVLNYEGEDFIQAYEGERLELGVFAMDTVMGEIEVEYLWSDPAAINADGTLNRGDYTLTLKARDYFGNTATKTLTLNVGDPDRIAPAVSVTADVMHLMTGTIPVLHPQAIDNSGRVIFSSYWSQDALDENGRLNAGVHLYTIKAEDYSGNRTVKSVVVYVSDEEYLGDNVIDEANPPVDNAPTPPSTEEPNDPLTPTPTPMPTDAESDNLDAKAIVWGFFLGVVCTVFLVTVACLVVWYVKKKRSH